MKLLWATWFILNINHAIDTGKYQGISIDEVEEHIDEGDLLPWLRERLGDDVDLSVPEDEDERELNERLKELLEGYRGQERRKWGVENSGLCLLIAWTNEIVQHAAGQADIPPR